MVQLLVMWPFHATLTLELLLSTLKTNIDAINYGTQFFRLFVPCAKHVKRRFTRKACHLRWFIR